MSNQLTKREPAVIDLYQPQPAPSEYTPQPTPTATGAEKLSDLFDWLTGDGWRRTAF